MKTFVINLEHDVARKRFMEEQLVPFAFLDVEYFAGINGKALSEEERAALYDSVRCLKELGRELKPGELGCSLSHARLYKEIADRGLQAALILEDDALISGYIPQALQAALPALENDKPRLILLTPASYHTRKTYSKATRYRIHKFLEGYYASGYLVNRKAAQVLSEQLLPIHMMNDNWTYFQKRLGIEIGVCVPFAVGISRSEISVSNLVDRDPVGKATGRTATGKRPPFIPRLLKAVKWRVAGWKPQRFFF